MYTCTSFLNFVSIKFWSWKGKWKVLLAVEQICIVAEYDFAWCLVYLLVCLTYKVRQSFGLINLSNIPKKLQTCEVWIIAGVRQSITTEAPLPLFFFFFAQSAYFGFGWVMQWWSAGYIMVHPSIFAHLIWSKPGDHLFHTLAREHRSAFSVDTERHGNEQSWSNNMKTHQLCFFFVFVFLVFYILLATSASGRYVSLMHTSMCLLTS